MLDDSKVKWTIFQSFFIDFIFFNKIWCNDKNKIVEREIDIINEFYFEKNWNN
jgi:hypothetical protein